MKFLSLITLGFVAGTYAAVMGHINNTIEPLYIDEIDVPHEKIAVGDFLFTRPSRALQPRVNLYGINTCPANRRWGDSCTPYKCQCKSDMGCWSCNGARYRCQPGPNKTPVVCLGND